MSVLWSNTACTINNLTLEQELTIVTSGELSTLSSMTTVMYASTFLEQV